MDRVSLYKTSATVIAITVFLVVAVKTVSSWMDCDPWEPAIRARQWAEKMGLEHPVANCFLDSSRCHATCTIAYDSRGEVGRVVTRISCTATDSLGSESGACWKN